MRTPLSCVLAVTFFGCVGLPGCGGTVLGPEPTPSPSPTPTPAKSGSPNPGPGVDPGPAPVGCSEVGCSNGLTLALNAPNGWKKGAYKFVIEADGKTQTCSGALPLKPCGATPSVTCTGAPLARIGESGCALNPSAHGFSTIDLDSGPAQIAISIDRDGVAIGGLKLKPTYKISRPNGPTCEPECRQASGTIPIGE